MKNYALLVIALLLLAVSVVIWKMMPEFVQQAGWVLVFGIWSFLMMLVFVVERSLVLWRAGGRGNVAGFVANTKRALGGGDLGAAIEACKQQGGSLANVVGAGLESYRAQTGGKRGGAPKDVLDETRRALQEASALESPNLERNLTWLSTIASLATMLGLLGTTIGMIRSFMAMSRAGAPDATALALGISEALINTAMGLFTAILASFFYNFFTTRVDAFNNRIDETSYEVLKLLETGKES
ncbi:MotA/TolQ/ExbB proton channel family protein [bacterium]|nr:MotA/TolQ/ExbB proton channel family protein [bacterium]